MTQQHQDRPRIFSYMTRSRFLHLEDALTPAAEGKPGKIRFFVGSYERGSGKPAVTAYHFLDDADARVIFADMSWGKAVDIKDFKGSSNGADGPVSRVLKIKGPKDGKFWVQIDNGPGQVIGAGAVKPAGEPTASISIALPIHDARALALAVIEYMAAWRVTAILRPQASPPAARQVNRETGEITAAADTEALFSEDYDKALADHIGDEVGPEEPAQAKPKAKPKKAQETPDEVDPPKFFRLANKAMAAGFDLPRLQEIINSQVPWRDKHITLQAAMTA